MIILIIAIFRDYYAASMSVTHEMKPTWFAVRETVAIPQNILGETFDKLLAYLHTTIIRDSTVSVVKEKPHDFVVIVTCT